MTMMMKERQRWQPEEDALLLEYVKQYGPKEWGLVSERMGCPLHRDPKSCLERWKNYLRPGLKKGSLSPEEQSLLISLQTRYGNKWKTIAAHLPGRTPKRLGKWWEVFKEKQHKMMLAAGGQSHAPSPPSTSPSAYDHILQTFAEKHVLLPPLPTVLPSSPSPSPSPSTSTVSVPSVALSLSPPRRPCVEAHQVPILVQLCEEVEEGRRAWVQHRKDAAWRLSRLEQQMETEKARRKREKVEEVEVRIKRLREEEKEWMERLEVEWKERIRDARAQVEIEEAKVAEMLARKQAKVTAAMQRLAFSTANPAEAAAASHGGHCHGYSGGGGGGTSSNSVQCFIPLPR